MSFVYGSEDYLALPVVERAVIIIGLTIIVIVAVVVVRVLTGRPASNLSSSPKKSE